MTTPEMTVGVLRVLTLEAPEAVAKHGRVIERAFPNVSTVSECIDGFPEGLPSPEAEEEALPAVLDLAREMATDVDALAVSCCLDPGVDTLRGELRVPVVGAGASLAAAALVRGGRVGALSLEEGTPPVVREILGYRLHAEAVVEGADTTNHLSTRAGQEAVIETVGRLQDAGCDVVAPACTGITTAEVLPSARAETGMDIVDPVTAMGAMAYDAALPELRTVAAGPS